MASLREYLNAKIKSKGSSLSAEKAKGKKYKSISAAKKAGALYYTNKEGKLMAAVFAEDLKSSVKPKVIPKAKPKVIPKAKPQTSGGRGDGKKELLQRQNDPRSPSRLKGAAWMKKNTYADYMALTKSEARALGLPATRLMATQHRLRNQKFKDGKDFFAKNPRERSSDPSNLAGRKK